MAPDVKLDPRTISSLVQVHPDLVKVVKLAYACPFVRFVVIHGLRTPGEEAEMVRRCASETQHSRHLLSKSGYACAVDVMALTPSGQVEWDSAYYAPIHEAFMAASKQANVPVEWGGDWKTLKDLGHFQLPWAKYP